VSAPVRFATWLAIACLIGLGIVIGIAGVTIAAEDQERLAVAPARGDASPPSEGPRQGS
jgi:hypothetical protein